VKPAFPYASFVDALMTTPVLVCAQVFGNSSFRPQQAAITAAAIKGDNVLVLMPTGGEAAHS